MPSNAYSSTPPVITTASVEGDVNYQPPTFPLGPFTKYAGNPLLVPNPDNMFESAYIYNATAIVLDNRVFLLYRAQTAALCSSIGLAWSDDGYDFTRLDRPVLEASEPWEAGGGVEDPRITRSEDGQFVMTYTSWDFKVPRLCLATSTDLVNWTKQPPLFPDLEDVEYCEHTGRTLIRKGHSKSGAIFPEKDKNGKYQMIFGDSLLLRAESDDLVHWTAKPYNEYFAEPVHPWESRLLEPGPAPIKTRDGKYILVYNAATLGCAGYRNNQYSISQFLIDYDNLENGPLARLDKPSLVVSTKNEREGLVNEVVFCEGLVQFKGKWFLYYGQADSELGVATADI
ncbi:hypothetical protein SPBR_04338 [Sporothrix brasiliensis 5110]|uniref:Uncharacterized protein n=1 Tax=Sporothrix brasiliensis 5110 TaxID=1398154 RepID=A0A0C2IXC5_9PEZI|nr:uncharacterized protein SPBR_04338 [Sporothrix brasiliensis 5110]KIH93781.1 hypothetical protein SPBR_04338 [Sporothrix brasiliensis 5110]